MGHEFFLPRPKALRMGYGRIQPPPPCPRALFFTTRLLREEEHTLQNEREVAESLLLDMMPRTGPCGGPPPRTLPLSFSFLL